MVELRDPPPPDRRPSTASARPPRLARAIRAHLASHDVTKVVYGAVAGLAIVVGLQHHTDSSVETVGALVGAALALALAETYSAFVGTETRERRRVRRDELPRLAGEAGAVAFGAAFPAVFFVLAALDLTSLSTAFTLAKWTGLGLIFAYGFLGSRLAGASVATALAHAGAIGAVGGLLIAFKALLH